MTLKWGIPVAFGILVVAYAGYRYYLREDGVCNRSGIQTALASVMKQDQAGDLIIAKDIRLLQTDGRQNMCQATMTYRKIDTQEIITVTGIEYLVVKANDGKNLNLSLPGLSVMQLR